MDCDPIFKDIINESIVISDLYENKSSIEEINALRLEFYNVYLKNEEFYQNKIQKLENKIKKLENHGKINFKIKKKL